MQHFRRLVIAIATTAAALTAAPAANAASTPDTVPAERTTAVVTLRYDDSQARGWETAIAAGVASWNTNVDNVKLAKAQPGTRAEIQIVATSGWPQATCRRSSRACASARSTSG